MLNNKSYQTIYESFEKAFPEFKQSIREWKKHQFNQQVRAIVITLKNGCYITFGSWKDADGEWVWSGLLGMSDKTREKNGVEEDDAV